MLEPDRRAIAAPFASLGREGDARPDRVQIDVAAGNEKIGVSDELTGEKRVPDEVTLPGFACLQVKPSGVAAVEFPHSGGQPAGC